MVHDRANLAGVSNRTDPAHRLLQATERGVRDLVLNRSVVVVELYAVLFRLNPTIECFLCLPSNQAGSVQYMMAMGVPSVLCMTLPYNLTLRRHINDGQRRRTCCVLGTE